MKKRQPDSPPASMARETDATGMVFPGGTAELTRAELERAVARPIAKWIQAACIWDGDAIIGDYRFVVFSIDITRNLQVYVQFWSEPGEPALWEVSSGRWNPPADKYLAGERSGRIAAMGFEVGGKAENFQREVEFRTPQDVQRVAKDVFSIFYDGCDYRGVQPINAYLVFESRAELQPIYESFTPEDLEKILTVCGYRVAIEADDDEEEPGAVLRATRRGIVTQILLEEQEGEQNLYSRAVLLAESPMPPEVARAVKEQFPDPDATLSARTFVKDVLNFDGGVTVEWVAARFAEWDERLRSERRQVRADGKGPAPASRRKPGVH